MYGGCFLCPLYPLLMLLIPIEKLKSGRDSFGKAREAHLSHKAKTIEPLGIIKRDEL